ncbi:MAG: MMPL family transporter [Thalassolituus sp.]|uniref:efflux RND transporter permease subunit n=1 Tax=Thalassolituus TaxID=187492 RepID=UPI001B653A14|nr:MMPL family transporter [Thalassolituus oleivorans]MBQ0728310.1 MMPL family transporter [Thalassolituus oleivorans]MBQ0780718.1 MMPL family transporter [Thalassolituus oleivorans]
MKAIMQRWIVDHPVILLVLFLMLSVLAAAGGKNLTFRGDYKIYFEEGYAPLNDFEEMQGIFNKNDNIAVLMVPKDGEVFTPEFLTLVKDYTEAAWQTPYSSRVDSLTNFQHTWSEEDDMIVEDLVLDPESLTADDLTRIRSIALAEPALKGRMVSASGEVALVNVTLQLPSATDNTAYVAEVMASVKALSKTFAEQYPNVEFFHTGVLPMNSSFATEGQKDMSTLIPAMLLLIIVLLAVLLRSILAMLATIIVLVLSVAATMGLGGWTGFFLSTGTINVPIVVLTIAVADCVHMIATMQFAMRQGKTRAQAVQYSVDLNWMPVFITSATTAIGFMTLAFSESPVFADFGILSAMGVMTAYLLSVTLFPAILMLLPIKVGKATNDSKGMARLADFIVARQRALLVGGAILIVAVGSLITKNQINDVATAYFSDATEFRQSVNKQEDTLSGSQSIDWALYSGIEGGVSEPEFIETVRGFSEWLRAQPEVDHVSTISDTFKRLNLNMHGDDSEWYRIPEERELAAQYLLLYEMSLPYGLDLNNQINIDKSSTRVTSTLKNLGSREIVDLEQRAQAWIAEHAPNVRMAGASPGLMFAHIGEANMHSMIISMAVAMVLISAILVFALRSVRLGAISLIPNLAPAVVGFGVWGVMSGEINLGLSIVTSMTLGIIVDDTVHFLSKYQRARKDGLDTEAAIRYAFISVGRALIITTVVLVMGFYILSFSSFRLNSDMGMATSMIIAIALVIDFFFLPPLLLWLDRDETDKSTIKNQSKGAEKLLEADIAETKGEIA